MAITKKDANAKYDKLRAQLKKGDISKEAFKAASNRIYKMYHGDANKATRNAPKAKPTAKAKPTVKKPVQTSKPKPDPQANKGKDGKPTGTYGKSLPSNPKLKNNTNRRRGDMVKGQMVGEDVKPLSKTERRRKSRRGTPAKKTSLTIRPAGSSSSRNRLARRRRGR